MCGYACRYRFTKDLRGGVSLPIGTSLCSIAFLRLVVRPQQPGLAAPPAYLEKGITYPEETCWHLHIHVWRDPVLEENIILHVLFSVNVKHYLEAYIRNVICSCFSSTSAVPRDLHMQTDSKAVHPISLWRRKVIRKTLYSLHLKGQIPFHQILLFQQIFVGGDFISASSCQSFIQATTHRVNIN